MEKLVFCINSKFSPSKGELEGDYADALLEGIDRTRLETDQFYTLQKMLIQLTQEGKTLQQISPTQTSTLLQIANSPTTAAYQAQAMLYQARGYEFPVIIPQLPNTGLGYGYTVFKADTQTNVKFSHFVPNPTNSNTSLSYNLADKETATIAIFDLNGRKIATNTLQGNGNYVFDTATCETGIYMYTIAINGNIVERNKLIVVK